MLATHNVIYTDHASTEDWADLSARQRWALREGRAMTPLHLVLPWPVKGLSPNARNHWAKTEDDHLRQFAGKKTHAELAVELSRPVSGVRNRCHRLGLVVDRKWTDDEVQKISTAYTAQHSKDIDLPGLSAELGRPKTSISRKARELGLTDISRPVKRPEDKRIRKAMFASEQERRSAQSAQTKARLAKDGHPRGALGMKHTQQAKDAIAEKSREMWAAMTQEQRDDFSLAAFKAKREKLGTVAPPRGKWKAGWREIGGQRCFFRSRWEANYARYLELLRGIGEIQNWQHEAKTFWFDGIKRGCVSYLPDFMVTNKDGSVQWHEVKGWMDSRSKTAIARMGRYHPKEVLIVIREKQYREIERKVSTLCAGWESGNV